MINRLVCHFHVYHMEHMTMKSIFCRATARQHMTLLTRACRICGTLNLQRNTYGKQQYAVELKQLFQIDIDLDKTNVHPSEICRAHELLLIRFRNSCNAGQAFHTSIVPLVFTPHQNENCQICKRGRHIRKRSKRQGTSCPVPHKAKIVKYGNDSTENGVKSEKPPTVNNDSLTSEVQALLHDIEHLSANARACLLTNLGNKLKEAEASLLAFVLGKNQSTNIYEDCLKVSAMYKDPACLHNLDPGKWALERNRVVTNFLLGATSTSDTAVDQASMRNPVNTCICIEQVYGLRMPKLIAPFSFLLGLQVYTATSSRTAVDLIGKLIPAGSYVTMQNWLQITGGNSPVCPPGTVMNTFDNQQIIAHKRQIGPVNKSVSSIVTTKMFVQLEDDLNMQENENLKPKNWFNIQCINEQGIDRRGLGIFQDKVQEIINEENQYYIEMEKAHYEQLHHFVQNAIDTVASEQNLQSGKATDTIDTSILEGEQRKTIITCTLCGEVNARRKIICTKCNKRDGLRLARSAAQEMNQKSTLPTVLKEMFLDLGKNDSDTDKLCPEKNLMEQIPSKHKGAKEVVVGEPVFVNPNSLHSVALALRKIGIENGIKRYGGSTRSWTFVTCDGRPHSLYQKLVTEWVVCATCNESFPSRSDFLTHQQEWHCGKISLCFPEFDWVYLRIGGGHYEMNVIRAYFELNWIPFIETMCENLGFTSDKAKAFARGCKDHHVAWELLMVMHMSSLQELVLPYVRLCLAEGKKPTPHGYFMVSKTICDPNVKYLHSQICRFSQGLINLRLGLRRNNALLVDSAKFHTKELFYGRPHPYYRKIELFDKLQQTFMPPEVRTVWDENISITSSGDKNKGQDFDFILEEKNRAIKHYIPKGTLPSDTLWKNVCCNLNMFEDLQAKTRELLGINKKGDSSGQSSSRQTSCSSALLAIRPTLRKYITSKKTGQNTTHTTLEGKPLHEDLIRFTETSTLKRIFYIQRDVLGENMENVSPTITHPVYITKEEAQKYNNIENKTKSELNYEIIHKLQGLEDMQMQTYFEEVFEKLKERKSTPKSALVSLAEEIENVIQMAPVTTIENAEDESDE